ncbi:hypothetical protein, partial [Oleiagrimonas sp.]|uniref:hypothetical protein n=1 Tax=Oleiagrimonas sp. TaxID=2010330 RepID=UPI00260D4D2A
PTAGRMVVLDAALHIGLFLALAAVLAPLGKRAWVLASLAVLGLTLEVVQWQVVGFAHLEWNDILSNETGVAIAALIHTCRHRTPHP